MLEAWCASTGSSIPTGLLCGEQTGGNTRGKATRRQLQWFILRCGWLRTGWRRERWTKELNLRYILQGDTKDLLWARNERGKKALKCFLVFPWAIERIEVVVPSWGDWRNTLLWGRLRVPLEMPMRHPNGGVNIQVWSLEQRFGLKIWIWVFSAYKWYWNQRAGWLA